MGKHLADRVLFCRVMEHRGRQICDKKATATGKTDVLLQMRQKAKYSGSCGKKS
jgi:hypothetical protein